MVATTPEDNWQLPSPEYMQYCVSGNPKGPTVVFLHGWPDGAAVFNNQYAVLTDRYRVVKLTLPGFEDGETGGAAHLQARLGHMPFFGYSFDDIAAMMYRTVCHAAGGEAELRRNKACFVCFDWGAAYTYTMLNDHPDVAWGLVGMDVGDHIKVETIKGMALAASYQMANAASYFLPGFVGDYVAWGISKACSVPSYPGQPTIRSRWAYPYFQYHFGRGRKPRSVPTTTSPGKDIPILYFFGAKKPLQFHSKRWMEKVTRSPSGKVVPLRTGHWFMIHHEHKNLVNEELVSFLSKHSPSATA